METLSDDCSIIFLNLSLEVDLTEIEQPETIINVLLNLASTRAAQNDVTRSLDRPDPVDTYRLIIITVIPEIVSRHKIFNVMLKMLICN